MQQAVATARSELAPTERWPTVPADVAHQRAAILRLEASLFAGALEQTVTDFEPYLTHTFGKGVYARTMNIPKGMLVIGKIHQHGHLNIISKGKCAVSTPWGQEILEAPLMFKSEPGTKRAVIALEDTVWTTFHENPDNTQDLKVLEAQVISPSFEHYDALKLAAPSAPALLENKTGL